MNPATDSPLSLCQRLSPLVTLREGGEPIAPAAFGALALSSRASSAFGDGTHPTTRICAGAVDYLVRSKPGSRVLDVGTGTAVLARIARARGASRVVATDIDPEALRAARLNCELDLHRTEIEFSSAPPDQWGPGFDLVVANILEGPLRILAPQLARAIAPGGKLLMSGFTRLQTPGLSSHFATHGLLIVSESCLEGWVLLELAAR